MGDRRAPSLESLFVGAFALLGVRLGTLPISDNSAFVHLRTGIDIVAGEGIPRRDPYSFTAGGEPWVVQSWLASAVYGIAERVGGFPWVVVLNGALIGVLAWMVARLARTGRPTRTLAAAAIAIAPGAVQWSPRPLIFGLLCLAATVTIVEHRRAPWLLVPVVWIWVNTHGSFPLGLAWLGVVIVGDRLDSGSWRDARTAARYAAWFVAGLVAGALNPLGPKLLTFAVTVGEKRDVFERVVEWRSPDFQRAGGLVMLLALAAMVTVLARARPPWRDVLPVAAFLAMSLYAMRNLPMLGVVAAPVLGRALRGDAGVSEPVAGSPLLNRAFAAVLAVVAFVFLAGAAQGQGLDLRSYPVRGVAWLDDHGRFERPHRVATQDVVGCYIALRNGRSRSVFVDDRVDMYPQEVSVDYRSLLEGSRRAEGLLAKYRIDTVLWDADEPLVAILTATGEWERRYRDRGFVVLTRRS